VNNLCDTHVSGDLIRITFAATINKYRIHYMQVENAGSKDKFCNLNVLTTTLIASFTLSPYSGFASTENNNNTLMEPEASEGMATATNATTTTNTTTSSANATSTTPNIVLVHGLWADGSSWSKVIPILKNAGYRVISVQLALHSLAEDVATVKRAIDLVGGPTVLVAHSFGGFVITNAAYNNPNVTGLVYVSAFAPDEGESAVNFVPVESLPPGLLVFDSGGFAYLNPEMFPQAFAQDVNKTEAEIMAITQKPAHQSLFTEKSGPPAWKQLPTWFEVSEGDRIIPPDAERMFAQRMNATTISLNSSHASLVSRPNEIAQLILDAARGSTG
jgi:pimeloyl-ACP methyl ester carboxylesterase